MTNNPEDNSGKPQLQAETDGGGERAIEDRHGPRRAAHQNWFGQGPVQRQGVALGERV